MKYVEEYLKDVIKVKPLGDLTTKDDELNGMSGEMVYVDGKCSDIFISHADYANWLEKQGESSIYNVPSREVILSIWDLGNEWKELTNYSISTEHGTQLDYIQKHWEESEYYLREKQGEKKPADKVEPKFHEGEWIANGDYIWKIVEVKPLHYILQSQDGNIVDDTISYVDKVFHSFTIKDAQDGDVLLSSDGSIFIFKEVVDFGCKHYIALAMDGTIQVNDNFTHFWESVSGVCPTTKEQRDLLFAKMKESGYEWDAEKKELKKIEQKPVSITDEWIEDYWQHKKVNNPYSYDKGEEIQFDHQGFVRFCQKYCKKPSEWSEEDESMRKTTIFYLENTKDSCAAACVPYIVRCIKWLKSLNPQKQWKPSDEQLAALNYVCRSYNPPATEKIAWDSLKNIEIMYGQLKKLREE